MQLGGSIGKARSRKSIIELLGRLIINRQLEKYINRNLDGNRQAGGQLHQQAAGRQQPGGRLHQQAPGRQQAAGGIHQQAVGRGHYQAAKKTNQAAE